MPFGANFAITRVMLGQLEPFRDGLDRVGATLISNGETELLLRVLDIGGRIIYWPDAEVAHRVPAERLTKTWFRRRALAQGVSDVRWLDSGATVSANGCSGDLTCRSSTSNPHSAT